MYIHVYTYIKKKYIFMIAENRLSNRYTKMVTRTKRYSVYALVVMIPPRPGLLALIAKCVSYCSLHPNCLFYLFAPVVVKCLLILTNLSYKAFSKP